MSFAVVTRHTETAAVALAPRERETLKHIAAGCTYLQAARQMGLSRHTVDAYLRRIRAKLDQHRGRADPAGHLPGPVRSAQP
ncbi:helix-turn-helix transcriptional regulator [Streptomyces sp. NPDC005917]|uniref:response regulator transcription factor n=1 Tax=unclassified Streptomyces TaxID=2593676 RepID=UPI0034104E59